MRKLALMMLAAAMATALPTQSPAQQPVSVDEIVEKLAPKPGTRSFRRGITVEGDEAANEEAPSINLYVTFAYDSDALETDALLTLDNLARALSNPVLVGHSFKIAGHTDARGSEEYNQSLSERRAAAVRDYLIRQHGIPAERLAAMGYGKSMLLDPTRPEDQINRRVQVINSVSASGS